MFYMLNDCAQMALVFFSIMNTKNSRNTEFSLDIPKFYSCTQMHSSGNTVLSFPAKV